MTVRSITQSPAEFLKAQRAFFATGATKPIEFRLQQLGRLRAAVVERQADIIEAVKADLGRPEYEGYFELGVMGELGHIRKRLRSWARPRRVAMPLTQLPGSAWVQPEPLGVVLIMGPWNYPFQLLMSPLMGAIAAGNCAIVKPSKQAPATSRAVAELVKATFEPQYVAVAEGGVDMAQALLAQKFDHIFFTGGARVGQIVMEAAAKHLTPVTLELGGKSPCIVDEAADLEVAARRIVWGKFINLGQTCIAPDYVLAQEKVKPELLRHMRQAISEFFGADPAQSPDLARVVNERQFDRLAQLLEGEKVVMGGQTNRGDRYIAPTILDDVSWEAPVMQAEIFGPLLPVLTYRTLEDAIAQINARPKPLALYLFTNSQAVEKTVLSSTSSGSACVNEVFLQAAIWALPFGGVGHSGSGSSHGKAGFETFSHLKSVLKKPTWIDLGWRYAPYAKPFWLGLPASKLGFLKKVIGLS
ncbi:MAG: aldehyde dehydrogenase [Elainellaceae cyanobacterium]